MKNIKLFLSMLVFTVLFSQSSFAISAPVGQTSADVAAVAKQQKDAKAMFKVQKKAAKLEKFFGNKVSRGGDKATTYLYYWIAAALLSILCAVLGVASVTTATTAAGAATGFGIFSILSIVFSLAATVFFILWIIELTSR
jgi:hypothetical protein